MSITLIAFVCFIPFEFYVFKSLKTKPCNTIFVIGQLVLMVFVCFGSTIFPFMCVSLFFPILK